MKSDKELEVVNVDFLRNASINTLEEFELSRRNSAANLAQQLKTLLHKIVNELTDADLARFAREARDTPKKQPSDPYRLDE